MLIKLYLLCTVLYCQAQIKYEKEYRLKSSKVPLEAYKFIQTLEIQGKVKWYFEESLTSNSIEAKFKKGGLRYSVEFDSLGTLEDVEIIQPWTAISLNAKEKITTYLERQFENYKISKIQFQFIGNPSDMGTLIKFHNRKGEIPHTLNYEFIVRGKKQGNVSLYEILFNKKGLHLNTAKVVLRNTDNLEF